MRGHYARLGIPRTGAAPGKTAWRLGSGAAALPARFFFEVFLVGSSSFVGFIAELYHYKCVHDGIRRPVRQSTANPQR